MRTIKFRGKRIDNDEWMTDMYTLIQDADGTWLQDANECQQIDPDTLGQFTGLLDKNGKEIYEGDILLVDEVWDGDTGSVAVYNEVGIKDGCFGYIGESSGELIPFCYNKVMEEIAGNVFDNPEINL